MRGLIKLNTNENPYPPAPRVLATLRAGVDGRLRLYPSPTAQRLRERLARFHRCRPDQIVVGNGSDELLALATRAFVEPAVSVSPRDRARATVQYFTPSYSLYPVLADIHGAHRIAVPLEPDFGLPTLKALRRRGQWRFDAALTYITTPNAPSGRGYATADLEALCRAHRGVVVLDEAYVDFGAEPALTLARTYPHVLVARTFSKAYSLCFQRVGYCVGHPALIEAIDKIRDSYNVNGLGQLAAVATLRNLAYYRRNFRRVIHTRERVARALRDLGFAVFPSQTNFLLARPPRFAAEHWLAQLRARKILVRWFRVPELQDYLRISVGTDTEMDALLAACRAVVRG